MRNFLLSMVVAVAAPALAQYPGMVATQQAQMAAQIAQQANSRAMRDAQVANQAAQNAQQQATLNAPCCSNRVAPPKFSSKSGTYRSALTVTIKDATRGAVIYYTTDGWTPTAASNRYLGPISVRSTTTLRAIAISPFGGRSRIVTVEYTVAGTALAPSENKEEAVQVPAAVASGGKFLLARGTPVPLVFAADVSSGKAEVGDKIPLSLAEDLKVGDVVVARKGSGSFATVTQVEKPGVLGLPGAVAFQVDSLQAHGATLKLRGAAAKEGKDKQNRAGLLAFPVPVGLFVRGEQADIKQGTSFVAIVDADAMLAPAN